MFSPPRHLLGPVLLLSIGGMISCDGGPSDPFPRDGNAGSHGDDDGHNGGHGDPVAGDRVALWDFVHTTDFEGSDATYVTRVSFFAPQVLGIPRPDGAEECFVNTTDVDPWLPMDSSTIYGQPVLQADGEEWNLDFDGSDDFWSRQLPSRTWTDLDSLTFSLPGGEAIEPTEYLDQLSLPTRLEGISVELSGTEGLKVRWVAGEPEDQLLLVFKSDSSGRTDYVVCAPLDDGEFEVPASTFADFPAGEVEFLLRRERVREDWLVDEFGVGRTVGVSQLRAEFTVDEDTFGDDSE